MFRFWSVWSSLEGIYLGKRINCSSKNYQRQVLASNCMLLCNVLYMNGMLCVHAESNIKQETFVISNNNNNNNNNNRRLKTTVSTNNNIIMAIIIMHRLLSVSIMLKY